MNELSELSDSKCYKKCKRKEEVSIEDLQTSSKEELIDRIKGLEAHNLQLRNLLQKKNESSVSFTAKKDGRPFDFSKVAKRHIFLKLYYIGWDYQGFTVQEDNANTIEHHLFKALQQCCLVEKRETSNYHRCGRTDKGVSAFSQVISIDVRSKLAEPDDTNTDAELTYCSMLNRLLPPRIRCYAWAHVGASCSARFDCTARTYKYWFPKGDLAIDDMRRGAQHLVGPHDFRNFCKMDVANGVTDFHKQVKSLTISSLHSSESDGYEMYEMTVIGSGFLWHQIRCIMSVLLLIGQRRESPDVVKQLLDVEANPRKPQYSLASQLPLNLFETNFDSLPLRWVTSEGDLKETLTLLQGQWTEFAIKQTMVREMIRELNTFRKDSGDPLCTQASILQEGVRPRVYKPLLKREMCDSLENKINHYVKKNKLVRTEDKT